MEWKAPNPAGSLEKKPVPALISAYFEFNHLKQLYRQGWLRRGLPKERCESVAEHTFGVAVLAYMLAETYFPELDAGRVLRLALLHDFGEIYAGDLIPSDGIDPQEKVRRELDSATRVFSKLPNGAVYLRLWQEYEAGETPEAVFVRQIDRLEMALQAGVYEQQGLIDPQEFYDSAARALVEPQLVALLEEIRAMGRPLAE
jgi:putative hydrolases of HD superfamily